MRVHIKNLESPFHWNSDKGGGSLSHDSEWNTPSMKSNSSKGSKDTVGRGLSLGHREEGGGEGEEGGSQD